MNQISRKMDEVIAQGEAKNWNPSQYRAGLHRMLSQCRQELRFGQVDLYVKPQPPTNRK